MPHAIPHQGTQSQIMVICAILVVRMVGNTLLISLISLAFCDGDTPITWVLKMHLNKREPAIQDSYRVLFLGEMM